MIYFFIKVFVDESMIKLSIIISGGNPSLDVMNPENVIVTNTSQVSKTINLAKVIVSFEIIIYYNKHLV